MLILDLFCSLDVVVCWCMVFVCVRVHVCVPWGAVRCRFMPARFTLLARLDGSGLQLRGYDSADHHSLQCMPLSYVYHIKLAGISAGKS